MRKKKKENEYNEKEKKIYIRKRGKHMSMCKNKIK
jgi:hypothetical protein